MALDGVAIAEVSAFNEAEVCDTDNDGIANNIDLDSDNDGCPDAQEGGALFTASQIANDTLIGGVQANGVPTIAGAGQTVNFAQDSTLNACTDTDMDGVADITDLDDDNDGIVDSLECTIPNINNSFESPVLTVNNILLTSIDGWTVTSGNIDLLTTSVFVPSSSSDGSAQSIDLHGSASATLDKTFTGLVPGAAVTFTFDYVRSTFGGNPAMQYFIDAGDGNGFVLINSLAPTTTNWTTEAHQFIVGNSGSVSIRLVNTAVGGLFIGVIIDNLTISGCLDSDGDNIANNLDLDSDNDGCPDFVEGGGIFTEADDGETAQGTVSGGTGSTVDTNLGNTVGTTAGVDLGVPTVANTGQTLGSSQNAAIENCTDTDGDSVPDSVDLDDDNDGILDSVEVDVNCIFTLPTNATIASFGFHQNNSSDWTSGGLTVEQQLAIKYRPNITQQTGGGPERVPALNTDYFSPILLDGSFGSGLTDGNIPITLFNFQTLNNAHLDPFNNEHYFCLLYTSPSPRDRG